MKGKTTEQIRKDFNIVNDFTPEEEEKVREETKYASPANATPADAPQGGATRRRPTRDSL